MTLNESMITYIISLHANSHIWLESFTEDTEGAVSSKTRKEQVQGDPVLLSAINYFYHSLQHITTILE